MNDTTETKAAPALADRIRSALTESLSSADIAAVIVDVEADVETLTAKAGEAERVGLDPLASAKDIAAARASAADAEFELKRLNVAAERLAARLEEAKSAEQHARDDAAYDAAIAERDALAADLSKQYPRAARTIADLLARIAASDATISEVNKKRRKGQEPLFSAETIARGFPQTGPHERLGQSISLPGFAAADARTPYWSLYL